MIKYLVYNSSKIGNNLEDEPMVGIIPISEKDCIPDEDGYYFFSDETTDKEDIKGYQAFVHKYLHAVLGFNLYLKKETKAGHTGSVDYLGIKEDGKIFLIEVKRIQDSRANFNVVFQAIKYFIDPFSIRDELFFISERKWTLKEDIAKNIRKTFPNIDLKIIQKSILNNLEVNSANVIIVIDHAPPQLIATAYTNILRHTKSECRILEMAPLRLSNKNYLYYRKYFSNNDWVDVNNQDNRSEHLVKDGRFNKIASPNIKSLFESIVSMFENDKYLFKWNTENIPYFTLYSKKSKGKYSTLYIQFYTSDYDQKGMRKIDCGSIVFNYSKPVDALLKNSNSLKKNNLIINQESYVVPKSNNKWFYFILTYADLEKIGVSTFKTFVEEFEKYTVA
jgi:hypothetical protein